MKKALSVFLVAMLAFGAFALVGCSSSEDSYKKQITDALDEYNKAYTAYSQGIMNGLGKKTTSDKLTQEDIDSIKKLTSDFESQASDALDKLENAKAPSKYKDQQADIEAYAKEMKKSTIPAAVDPLNKLKVGQTLADFTSSEPDENTSARLNALAANFNTALEKIGITSPASNANKADANKSNESTATSNK